jgi:NAD(P)H-hydrate epimerase
MREWEQATWNAGQTEAEVIQRVGKRIARRARKLTGDDDRILILAGKGHNGDDARAARASLDDRKVKLLEVLLPDTDLLDLELALQAKPALIIDGLFGVGLNRPLSEWWRKIIGAVNAANIPVLAVDVPSGLDADTGAPLGAAIEATVTLTIGAPKAGLITTNAARFVGRLEVADEVGLVPCPATGELQWSLPADFDHFPPPRPVAGHKGSFGHAVLIAGSQGYHGASVLATRGAQRAQPGLATLYTQESVYGVAAAQLQSAMVDVLASPAKFPERMTALAIGPGMAAEGLMESLRPQLRDWWQDLECPMLADASALAALAPGPVHPQAIRVITPHPGEAARLLECTVPKVQADRPAAVRELARKFGNTWVILKGNQTLIGRAEGPIFINSSGNPHLAQGGSGDLLSGFITGLLAQPALQTDPALTLRYAVWQHGAAADKLQADRRNWTIEDLADELGNA